uniref:NADH dehydrogenase subunit 6 n=1 Tax=Flustrellidra hispida TaxID=97271 RepID=Q15K53_9BILA|nr:NADH dehydrogenase subunit 6 [Flustrellidra hispida]AAZ76749.1 NADH dehydrogenase subunit 6 [Flustrellidra hispida]
MAMLVCVHFHTLLLYMTSFILLLTVASLNPLRLSILLMLFSMGVSLLTAYTVGTWYGVIMFVVYISGLLVVISYFVSLNPNTSDKTSPWALLILAFLPPLTAHSASFSPLPSTGNTFAKACNTEVYWFMGLVLFFVLLVTVYMVWSASRPVRMWAWS